ncbi:MAG: deoxyribodipyrimidine photo-lyase [Desulfovibrio sp.]|jgi:deoxyribodipyrimidine photo-lyase|nr:deoxyribodipyrimidine photo-lyase [Desulfovibrio sp.]
MHPARARLIHNRPQQCGPVLYWMHRELRARDNWGLLHARHLAAERGQPLAVVFCLARHYPLAALAHFAFLTHGLDETARSLEALGIPFVLLRGEPGQAVAEYAALAKAGLLVTDADPTRPKRAWLAELLSRLQCPAIEVDGRNVVPARRASDKAEYMARTIRPKIQRLLPEFLAPFPTLAAQTLPWHAPRPSADWPALLAEFGPPPEAFPPGETAAASTLAAFLGAGQQGRLARYADDRNTPLDPASSLLSPHLHFGHISAQRIALEVLSSNAPAPAREAFLEQLIVRRELAENFCLHTPNYDSVDAFPAWARATLAKHQADRRPFLATEAQLDSSATPDPLWNAAQRQLLATGHMHGWLRMYWAKQILLWSPDAETALARVLRLNDSLSLDGRDVNGYAGAAWSIGGVHDRPWPERPVFGTVRSMTFSGAARKFDVQAFIDRWTRPRLP